MLLKNGISFFSSIINQSKKGENLYKKFKMIRSEV
jgi:hypothetical protein